MKLSTPVLMVVLGLVGGLIGPVSSVNADTLSLFHGSITNRYRFRTTGALRDQDLETLLTLDIGNAQADRFSGAIQAGGIFDLDGNQGGATFASVYDTFSSRAVGRLYYAHFDAKDLGPIKNLRFGRQHRYDFESLYFDGLTLESDPFHGFTLSVFGGMPVHLFENQFGVDPGDWMVGGALQWNPISRVQARFDYVHLKDKVNGFRATVGDQQDDLFGTTVWWDIDEHFAVTSRFTSFSDQVRDVSLGATYNLADHDLSVRLNFFRLLKGYSFRVIDLDGFTNIAGTYQPYTDVALTATKGFGEHFAMDGGVQLRFLDDRQVAGAFNHGFERFFLSLSTYDLLIKGLSLSATGDYYHGEDNTLKNNTFGGSFSANQDLLEKRLQLSVGTAFYLYRFNLFAGNESNNVQTYFARIKGKIRKDLEARIGYEFEHNILNDFHSVDARLTWSF